jgi:hypothetical protein
LNTTAPLFPPNLILVGVDANELVVPLLSPIDTESKMTLPAPSPPGPAFTRIRILIPSELVSFADTTILNCCGGSYTSTEINSFVQVVVPTQGEGDAEAEGLTETDGEIEADGDTEADGLGDLLADGETDADGLIETEGEFVGLTLADGLPLADGDSEADGDGDQDADGLVEADGDADADGEKNSPIVHVGVFE